MTVVEQLTKATQDNRTLFSFELLPPRKGNSIQKVFDTIDTLRDFNPSYINITSHRDEVEFVPSGNGTYKKRIARKRPGTVAVAAAINHEYKIPVVPHVICGGFTPEETENALIDLNFLGIHDLLMLRGDRSPRHEWIPADNEHHYALDLISQVNKINEGQYLDGTLAESFDTPFSFGVAGYPEKHEEAPNMDSDIYYLKKKVEAGAQYIVTQMFFDNEKYFQFVDRVREAGITVPVVPGLKPITRMSQLNILPQIFKVDIPEDLASEIRKCKSTQEVEQVGIEWGIKQGRELIQSGVPSLHFYTMMASKSVSAIANQIF